MLSEISRSDFVSTVRQAVRSAVPEASAAAVDLITAHAGFESGFGQSRAFKLGNNLFNITRTSSDPAPVILGPDTEYGPTGAPKAITQRFAAYASPVESVEHYSRFVGGARYRGAWQQILNGDLGFIATLGAGGFFTLPLDQYEARFNGALEVVRAEPDLGAAVASSEPPSNLRAVGWLLAAGGLAAAGLIYFRGAA